MRRALTPHPAHPCPAVDRIDVEVARAGESRLVLAYVVTGDIDALRVPEEQRPERADELWRHSCCEAFVRLDDGYLEFNFSPSAAWAAYCFSAYREGMTPAPVEAPRIETTRLPHRFELHASVVLDGAGPLQLGLATVLEDKRDRLSYWALSHPPGRPDFHHPSSFTFALS